MIVLHFKNLVESWVVFFPTSFNTESVQPLSIHGTLGKCREVMGLYMIPKSPFQQIFENGGGADAVWELSLYPDFRPDFYCFMLLM